MKSAQPARAPDRLSALRQLARYIPRLLRGGGKSRGAFNRKAAQAGERPSYSDVELI